MPPKRLTKCLTLPTPFLMLKMKGGKITDSSYPQKDAEDNFSHAFKQAYLALGIACCCYF
jgi:hypothetical protein